MGIFGCSICKDQLSIEKNNELNNDNRQAKLNDGNKEKIINIEKNKENENNIVNNKKENDSEEKIEIQIGDEDNNNMPNIKKEESNNHKDIAEDNNNHKYNLPLPLDDSRDEKEDEQNQISYEIIKEDENIDNNN